MLAEFDFDVDKRAVSRTKSFARTSSNLEITVTPSKPQDALSPWIGTPEGDKMLRKVLDPRSKVGKPTAPSHGLSRADAKAIFAKRRGN